MRKPTFPATLPDDALPAPDDTPEPIPFTPVPRQRTRRHGWSEDRQRQFIAAPRTRGGATFANFRARCRVFPAR